MRCRAAVPARVNAAGGLPDPGLAHDPPEHRPALDLHGMRTPRRRWLVLAGLVSPGRAGQPGLLASDRSARRSGLPEDSSGTAGTTTTARGAA